MPPLRYGCRTQCASADRWSVDSELGAPRGRTAWSYHVSYASDTLSNIQTPGAPLGRTARHGTMTKHTLMMIDDTHAVLATSG